MRATRKADAAPIAERIRAAMAGRSTAPYFDILRATFPADRYPRATNYATGGGPPGACMSLGAAVRRMGGSCHQNAGGERVVWIPADASLEPRCGAA